MRKPLLIANWKMNQSKKELDSYVRSFSKPLASFVNITQDISIVFAVPFTMLESMQHCVEQFGLKVIAQNVHHKVSGAYTGEISALMLKELGIWGTIVGHSERRQYFGETDALVVEKANLCLTHNLVPVICIGESLQERQNGQTQTVIYNQMSALLDGVTDLTKIVIAYEPVWAIGTGLAATADQAQEVHAQIRSMLQQKGGSSLADNCSILYGGSMKASNTKELMSKPDIDGGLVGGASLIPEEFAQMVREIIN